MQQDQAADPHLLFIVGTKLELDGPKRLAKLFVKEKRKGRDGGVCELDEGPSRVEAPPRLLG
jgi:hypothetical protein